MADWTSGLPQPAGGMDIGGLLGLAQRANQLQQQFGEQDAARNMRETLPPELKKQIPPGNPYSYEPSVKAITGATTSQAEASRAEHGARTGMMRDSQGYISSLVSKDNPTYDDIGQAFLAISRNLPQDANGSAVMSGLFDRLKNIPRGNSAGDIQARKQLLADWGTQALGPGGAVPSAEVFNPATGAKELTAPGQLVQRQAPGGGLQAQPSPIQEQGVKASAAAEPELESYKRNITPAIEMYKAVDKLAALGKTFGEGVTERNKFASFLQSMTPELAKKYGINPEQITAINEANKWSANLAASDPRGEQNQERLLTTIAGTPNAKMDSTTIKNMLATNIALGNMRQVALRQAKAMGSEADFQKNVRKETDKLEPEAFAFGFLPKDRQKAMLDKYDNGPKEARDRFYRSAALARQYAGSAGLVTRPQ